jgi:phosphoribosylformylglycinamidine cyclo-ligase
VNSHKAPQQRRGSASLRSASHDAYARAGVSQRDAEGAVEALVRNLKLIETGKPSRVVPLPNHYASVLRIDDRTGVAFGTDGVGTKMLVAERLGDFSTIGIDCVAMNVNDLICVGAEPIAMLDFVLCRDADAEVCGAIGAGLRKGAERAGIEIPGGEIAQVGEIVSGWELGGSAIGLVELDAIVDGGRVEPGDAIIGLPSSGLHSNGYTLVRHVLLGAGRMRLDTVFDEFGNQRTLGEELLTPTKIYARDCLDLIKECDLRALAHITGGGVPGNLSRVLPDHADAVVDRSTWRPQPIFELVREKGRIEDPEMESTFNMGVGMIAIVAPADADRTLAFLAGRGIESWQLGEVVEGTGSVQMVGSHTRG